jgi:hypothetical protein
MADNGETRTHEHTYLGFVALMKWGTIGAALVAAFVVFLISK